MDRVGTARRAPLPTLRILRPCGSLQRPRDFYSLPCMASMLYRVSADKSVPVRHRHPRQGLVLHRLVPANILGARQDVGGERLALVAGEGLGLRPWHGAPREVEDR